jgi:hypothetical protein
MKQEDEVSCQVCKAYEGWTRLTMMSLETIIEVMTRAMAAF